MISTVAALPAPGLLPGERIHRVLTLVCVHVYITYPTLLYIPMYLLQIHFPLPIQSTYHHTRCRQVTMAPRYLPTCRLIPRLGIQVVPLSQSCLCICCVSEVLASVGTLPMYCTVCTPYLYTAHPLVSPASPLSFNINTILQSTYDGALCLNHPKYSALYTYGIQQKIHSLLSQKRVQVGTYVHTRRSFHLTGGKTLTVENKAGTYSPGIGTYL